MTKPSFGRPKEPGRLSDGCHSYSIPHRSKYYTPWLIEAERPTWRDLWAVARGRYQPRLKVTLRLTTEGFSQTLKDAWSGPHLEAQLNQSSSLLVPLIKKTDGEK